MYETHFELKRRPFTPAPDARAFVAIASAAEALEALVHCCQRRAGAGVLVGEAGTGKTVLCQVLSARLQDAAGVAVIPGGHFPTRRALLQAVLHELHTGYEQLGEQELRLRLRDRAADHLRQTGKPIVLILDDAHRLNDACLEELRDWLDWALDGESLLLAILAGQPSLEEHLAEPRHAGLMQRIGCHTVLEPLDGHGVAAYVQERLRSAGAARELFTAEALRDVAHISGGLPRAVNALCDHALLLAYACEQTVVTGEFVRAAYEDLRMLPLPLVPPLEAVPVGDTAAKQTDDGSLVQRRPAAGAQEDATRREEAPAADASDGGSRQLRAAEPTDVEDRAPDVGDAARPVPSETHAASTPHTSERPPVPAAAGDPWGATAAEKPGDDGKGTEEPAEDGEWAVIEVGAGVTTSLHSGSAGAAGTRSPAAKDASVEEPAAADAAAQPGDLDIVQPPSVIASEYEKATGGADRPEGGVVRDFGSPEPAEAGRTAERDADAVARPNGISQYAGYAGRAGEPESPDIEDSISAEVLDLCVETHQSIRKLATRDDGLPGDRPPRAGAFATDAPGHDDPACEDAGPADVFTTEVGAGAATEEEGVSDFGEAIEPLQPSTREDGPPAVDEDLQRAGREAMKAWSGICERLASADSDSQAPDDVTGDPASSEAGAAEDYDIVLPEPTEASARNENAPGLSGNATSPTPERTTHDAARLTDTDAAAADAEHGIVLDIPAEPRRDAEQTAARSEAERHPSEPPAGQHGSHHADAVELARLTRRLAELFLHRRGPADER